MTPSNHSNLYRRCASAAIASTAALEDRNEGTIFQELADALKIGVNAVRQRRDGRIDPAFTDLIARMGVRRGMLTYAWLENFLRAGKHPNREEILGELFPDEVGKPVPHLILQNLPAPSSPHFVMRLQQYSEIVRALYRYGIVVLVGAGGMGKSTIALQIARHCMMFEPPDARFQPPAFDAAVWVSDRDKPGRLDLAAVLDTIAKTLGSPHLAGRPMEIRQSQVDQLLRQQKILLIVDNVDTVNDLALLRWLLAVPEPSKALITTRTLTPVLLECASLIHVNAMGHEESQELFTHRAAEVQLGPVDSKLADALLAAAGGIPKALTMMLGQLRVGYPPDQILADAKNHRSDLLSALFERSWALLDKHAQQVLMALTAFIAPAEYQALAAVSDLRADELAITLKTLFALSLIDYEQRKPNVEQLIEPLRVTMHILARQYALARLGEVPVLAELFRERWLQWCVATVRERGGFTLNDIAQLTLLETCEPDLDEALAVAAKAQRHYDVIALARGLEFLYYVTAQWEKKLTLHRRYIDAARASRDVEEEIYALALHIQLLSRQGRPWLADEELRRLDNLAAPRQRDPATFFTLQHTCGLHALAAGRLSDALVHWQAVIARGSELGPDMVHAGHHWKGRVLQLQEQIVAARHAFQQALELAESLRIGRFVARNLLRLAELDIADHELVRAEERLTSCRVLTPPNDSDLQAWVSLVSAELCVCQGQHGAAAHYFRAAIPLFKRMDMEPEWRRGERSLTTINDL